MPEKIKASSGYVFRKRLLQSIIHKNILRILPEQACVQKDVAQYYTLL
jgi:hypothetical protein